MLVLGGLIAGCGGGSSGAATADEHSTSTSTSTSSTTTSTRTAKPKPKPVKLTVEVNGDILVHSPVWQQALAYGHGNYDFRPMLREIRPYIRGADLAICHVETPMTPRPPQGYPVFNTPTQLATAIHWAGYRICDTASNHSVDMGQYGIDQTGHALDRAGVLHTGSFASPSAQNRVLITRVKGIKVAFLAYTEMTNGIPLPHPWSVNLAHVAAVRRMARAARRAGAQVVIVNFHWGDEFVTQPSTFQRDVAGALTTDPDITAIVGQHVHIVQPIERVNGKLVVFGEGQILSNQSSACCPVQSEDGMLVFLHIVVRGNKSEPHRHQLHANVEPPPGLHGAADRRRAAPARGHGQHAAGLLPPNDRDGRADPAPPRADPGPPAVTHSLTGPSTVRLSGEHHSGVILWPGEMAPASVRTRILDSALSCFIEFGYDQTTIARIRERSEVTNGALFHHFPSKEAIADALYVEALSSFQEGLWELLSRRPRSVRAAVRAVLAHQLAWTEAHADRARFLYMRGHVDWDTPAGAELAARNRSLADAYREWMAPLVRAGQVRPMSMLMATAIVGGPAHAIARRWLSGEMRGAAERLPRRARGRGRGRAERHAGQRVATNAGGAASRPDPARARRRRRERARDRRGARRAQRTAGTHPNGIDDRGPVNPVRRSRRRRQRRAHTGDSRHHARSHPARCSPARSHPARCRPARSHPARCRPARSHPARYPPAQSCGRACPRLLSRWLRLSQRPARPSPVLHRPARRARSTRDHRPFQRCATGAVPPARCG